MTIAEAIKDLYKAQELLAREIVQTKGSLLDEPHTKLVRIGMEMAAAIKHLLDKPDKNADFKIDMIIPSCISVESMIFMKGDNYYNDLRRY